MDAEYNRYNLLKLMSQISTILSGPGLQTPSGRMNKYLAIYFQVFAYEEQLFNCEPQMNADKRRQPVCSGLIRVHPRSVKAVFPGKNPGKLLAGYLSAASPEFVIIRICVQDKKRQCADIAEYGHSRQNHLTVRY